MQNKKKKIGFFLQTMVLGGVENSLSRMLKRFPKEKYDLHVILFYVEDKTVLNRIPENVHVSILDIDRKFWLSDAKTIISNRIKNGDFFEAISVGVKTIIHGGTSSAFFDISKMPDVKDDFDTAVCFHMHSAVVLRYVAEKVKAKNKIAWIRNDFEESKFRVDLYRNDLAQYDHIIAVSKQIEEEFVFRCPEFTNKTTTIHNILEVDDIIAKSKEPIDDEHFIKDKRFKIVSVGRFVDQKGFDISIETCKNLVEKGYSIGWYLIGWGPDEQILRKMIGDYHIEDSCIVLGRKINPYPYMAACDLYVQTSRHEGYAGTISEAKALSRNILATNFTGIHEQLIDGENGIIVESMSPREVSKAIICYINGEKKIIPVSSETFKNEHERNWVRMLELFDGE